MVSRRLFSGAARLKVKAFTQNSAVNKLLMNVKIIARIWSVSQLALGTSRSLKDHVTINDVLALNDTKHMFLLLNKSNASFASQGVFFVVLLGKNKKD